MAQRLRSQFLFSLFGVILMLLAHSPPAFSSSERTKTGVLWLANAKKLPASMRAKASSELKKLLEAEGKWSLTALNKKQRRTVQRIERKCRPKGGTNCAVVVGKALSTPFVFVARANGSRSSPILTLELIKVAGARELAAAETKLSNKSWRENLADLVQNLLESQALRPPEPEPPVAAINEPLATAPPAEVPLEKPPQEPSTTLAHISVESSSSVDGDSSADPNANLTEEIVAQGIGASEPPADSTANTITADLSTGAKETEKEGALGLSIAAGPLLLVPSADISVSGGGTAEILFFLPIFEDPNLRRVLGISLEAGWYPLSGKTKNEFSEFENTTDGPEWTTTEFRVDWSVQTVPVLLGVVARMPTEKLLSLLGIEGLPIAPEIFGRAGGAFAWGSAKSSLNRPGSEPFVTDNTGSDVAWGFYAAVGGGLMLGLGALILEYRYTNVRLDFDFPEWNPELGDLGGHTCRLAYRFDF